MHIWAVARLAWSRSRMKHWGASFPPLAWVDILGKCQYTPSLPGLQFHYLVVARDSQRLWKKTLKEKPEWSPVRRLQGISVTFRQLLQPGSSPVISTLSCHWTRRIRTREWDWSCASLPHFNRGHAQVMTSLPVILQVLWQRRNGESAGEDTGSCGREPAHWWLKKNGRPSLGRGSSGVRQPPVWPSSSL